MLNRLILLLLSGLILVSCVNDLKDKFNPKPDASSGVNQIAVIADDAIWESALGDSLRYYFEAPYPILNQPEPQFDLRHFTPQDLKDRDIFRELRAYLIIANTNDATSPTAELVMRDIGNERVGEQLSDASYAAMTAKDKWANGQQLNYVFAETDDGLLEGIIKSYPAIAERVRKHNTEVLDAEVYFEGLDRELMDKMRSIIGVEMKIPDNFILANEDENFIWMIYDRNKSVSNIIAYKTKYQDADQLTKEAIKTLTDSVTRRYIQSTLDSTYMIINDVDLPLFYYTRDLNGHYTIEMRGIWEMENDFMGGPFNAFVMVDETRGNLILLNGFVYAPGELKRNLLQKLTHVMETSKLVTPQSARMPSGMDPPVDLLDED